MSDNVLANLIAQLSGKRMMEHCRNFARWTKHAGTPEELESLEYVEEEIATYGYRTELISHEAYISLPEGGRVEVDGRELRCIAHSFSRSSPPGGLRAEVVYVGAGKEEDLANKEVRGRIVLVDGIATPAASLLASRAGAVGQVHVSPHEHLHEMCVSSVWGSPTHETVGRLPSTVIVTVGKEDGEALKREVAGGRRVELTLHAEVDTRWRPTPILVAELPGPAGTDDEPFVLFTGHHDTWYFGVMDNGGANATMLEVARLCALNRARWRRGLRVIFWSGHSQGRYSSSTWYADANWEELVARAVAHVNVDSTGGLGNTVVADTTAAAELQPLARESLLVQAGQEFTGRRMGRAGDQSFWGIGVPSIFGNMSEQPASSEANASAAVFGGGNRLGHGTGWWWHTPDDTLDKIDEEILVRDTRIYLHAVWRLLTDPVLPLDYAEHGQYLTEVLEDYQRQAQGRVDLSRSIDRARALTEKARRLRDIGRRASDEGVINEVNSCLVALSRLLVPVDYTEGDRFEHDPALYQPPVPALKDVARLTDTPPGSPEGKFLETGLVRAHNRVAWALLEANRVLDRSLARLQAAGVAL